MSLHNVTPGAKAPDEFNVIIEIPMNADPIKLQLYALGSASRATSVQFANHTSADTIMAVYAPSSTVSLENNIHVVGAVAAKKVVMQNYTSITYDSRVEDITGSDFARTRRLIISTNTEKAIAK